MPDETPYDLIVVGAGAAGSTAAFEAVGRGARVALIEHWKVGGTCLNAGCDPTKTLVHIAQVFHEARSAAGLGVIIPEVRTNRCPPPSFIPSIFFRSRTWRSRVSVSDNWLW